MVESSDTSALEVYGGTRSKKGNSNRTLEYLDNTFSKISMWRHFFTYSTKATSSSCQRLDEVGQTNDPNYCIFHRMVHHPTCRCNVLKDKIQVLIEAGVLTLKLEYNKATA